MRVAWLFTESRAIAWPSRSIPAISALMMRRSVMSPARKAPLTIVPSAICQSVIWPLKARALSAIEVTAAIARPISSTWLRS